MKFFTTIFILAVLDMGLFAQNSDKQVVKAEHDMINASEDKNAPPAHTMHSDAQWFPDAGLGLFIHWGLSSVKNMDISWPMIPGRPLANKKLDSTELLRVINEKDYNLNGKPPAITPNEYWAMAKDFNPRHYDPDKWIKAAKDAGFTYAVLTTRHHEGFALWPSGYGDFSTKNYMGGQDLLKPFVDACRKYGLKLGFYYSPPNWYFDREYMNFLYGRANTTNPGLPKLDADLQPRTTAKTDEEIKKHQAEYAAMVKGQMTELLTRYGKIDLLWFDGKPPIPNGNNVITADDIRKLQPGIVINPRLHGKGDFVTFERNPPTKDPDGWAEFCNTWTNSWANSNTQPFRSNAFVLGQFVAARAWGVNYLLGVGPTSDGVFPDAVYENMKVVQNWIRTNKRAVQHVQQLPAGETASVPATAHGSFRYLFAIPEFKADGKYDADRLPVKDIELSLKTLYPPKAVRLSGLEKKLDYSYKDGEIRISLPAGLRTNLVDVVEVELTNKKIEITASFQPLFNGKDLSGWSSFLKTKGKNNDPDTIFSVSKGLLHITGKEFGYLVTEKTYSNFHLIVEFKWGERRFPPRENKPRDNGILYYVVSQDKVWPRAIECQIQEGDCGDFWLIDSVTVVIDGKRTEPTKNTRLIKKQDNEKPLGEWNRIEVIAKDGKCTHVVNGVVVNEAEDASIRSGRIIIQSEGAEIWYRKIEIKELNANKITP